jgi:hypothetical protein
MRDDDPLAARDAAEVLLCTAFLLAVPTLPERQLAWIRQMAAVQRPATREYIDRNWPKPVREALLGPDRPATRSAVKPFPFRPAARAVDGRGARQPRPSRGALDSIPRMEGRMVDEAETRTGPLDSYSAPDLALAIEPAAAVGALRVHSAIVPMVNADNNQHGFDENMRLGNYVDGVKGLVGLLREHF